MVRRSSPHVRFPNDPCCLCSFPLVRSTAANTVLPPIHRGPSDFRRRHRQQRGRRRRRRRTHHLHARHRLTVANVAAEAARVVLNPRLSIVLRELLIGSLRRSRQRRFQVVVVGGNFVQLAGDGG